MLTEEKSETIKKQIINHIEKGFPEDKQEFAKQQILSMSSEQLEEFLKQNNLAAEKNEAQQCIFCSIVSGKINSYKIDENDDALAVLEINPISRGHTIIIPKTHTPDYGKEPGKEIKNLIEIISERIKKKLKPKKITMENTSLFGHQIINIIPNYENEELISSDTKRKPSKPEELEEIQKILVEEKKEKPLKKPEPKKIDLKKEKLWLPKRIP